MHKELFFVVALLFAFPALSSAGEDLGALLGQAIEDINYQSFDLAEKKLRKVLKVEPNNSYAQYYLASTLAQTNRAKEAIPYLENIQSSASLFPEYDSLLASAYMAANIPEKAVPIYKKILNKDLFNAAHIFQYATALEANGDMDLAVANYKLLTQSKTPYTDAAFYQMANIFSQLGSNRLANNTLNRIDSHSDYGAAATAYQASLQPSLKPLSVYLSAEYFYTDNPGSASSTYAKGAVPQEPVNGSTGQNIVAVITSAPWEINPHAQISVGYTYFSSLYDEKVAKNNEFTGHFFNASSSYTFSPTNKLETKLLYQILNLGEYNLAKNYGGTITFRHSSKDQLSSAYISLDYLRKRHNQTFGETGLSINMQYLDANSPTVSMGGYQIYSSYNAMVSLDYSLLFERTLTNTNAILNEKAQDSAFREHTLAIHHSLPFQGAWAALSLDASLRYSYRNYINPQSGTSLPSIKPGNYFIAETTSASTKAQYAFGTRFNLNLSIGAEWTNAVSQAVELSYKQTRYYGQLSGSY